MTDAQTSSVKQAFLYALVVSVGLSAILGIMAILSNRFGWLEIRVLLTAVTIAGASICGLACGAYLATNRGQVLAGTGVALTLLAAVLIVAGIWMIDKTSDTYWQLAASASVFAVACAHLALLSLARLAEWFRWSLAAAYVVIFGVAALIVVAIIAEPRGDGMFRLLGVAVILDATITLLIPIFHRLSRPEFAEESEKVALANQESIDAEIARLRERIAELERQKLQTYWGKETGAT
jgi:hypothetical protein